MKPSAPQDVLTLIDSDAVSLRIHVRKKIVHHEFRSFVRSSQFREVLEKGLEVFIAHRAKKWLSDNRGNGALSPADSEWALTSWAPRAIAAGLKYWAVVMPEKVVGQMNMRRMLDAYEKKGVTALPFSDPSAAMRWLEAPDRA